MFGLGKPNYGKTLLHVENVSLEYDGRPVLKNVNTEVHMNLTDQVRGQVVGFLGPSGIGKTSLFRIIAGLNKPTSGKVYIRQCDCGRPDCNREQCAVRAGDVGVVAQSYPLFEHRTVLGNLMLAATRLEKNAKAAKERVEGYLNEFGLMDKSSLFPAQLSGGQRQRVAIIQQILCSEHYLLMDEPFSGLDMLMLEKTAALIQKVAAMDALNTIIICTHDITAAASVADHIWLLGRDRDENGEVTPGARIVQEYDLIERDLAWHPDLTTQPRFGEFVKEVKQRFRTL